MKAKILLLALWTLSVEAADYKVGFDQLLQAAIEHSEDLASANSQLELAKYSATYNIKSVSPQVTLSGSTTYGNSESFSTSAQSMQKKTIKEMCLLS